MPFSVRWSSKLYETLLRMHLKLLKPKKSKKAKRNRVKFTNNDENLHAIVCMFHRTNNLLKIKSWIT